MHFPFLDSTFLLIPDLLFFWSEHLRAVVLCAEISSSVADMRASCDSCSVTSADTGAYDRTPDRRSPQRSLLGAPSPSHSPTYMHAWFHRLCMSSYRSRVLLAAVLTATCAVILVGITWGKADLLYFSDIPTEDRLQQPVPHAEQVNESGAAVAQQQEHYDETRVPAVITYEGVEPVRCSILLSQLCFFFFFLFPEMFR
jgi:hypothetical protein